MVRVQSLTLRAAHVHSDEVCPRDNPIEAAGSEGQEETGKSGCREVSVPRVRCMGSHKLTFVAAVLWYSERILCDDWGYSGEML